MPGSRRKRIAQNQKLLRDANALIAEKTDVLARGGLAPEEKETEFLCECGRPECEQTLSITVEEFEAAHDRHDHFVVVPGHEVPEIEDIVERHDRYLVARKKPGSKPEDVT